MGSKIRAFICIDFPNNIVKEITRIQSLVSKKHFTGKLTEPENLHLTLKFLGEIDKEKLEFVKSSLEKIKHPSLELRLSCCGIFSFKKKPRIVWVKLSENVFSLQEKIDSALTSLFPKEKRFMSHVTIARVKYVADKISFKNYVSKISPKRIRFSVDRFNLKSSSLSSLGPVYELISSYQLTGNNN